MSAALVKIITGVVLVAIAVVLVLVAVRRTRSEPRRLSNGVLIGLAAVASLEALGAVGAPGVSLVTGLVGLLVVLSPLLIFVLAVLLIMNGVQMVRRESRSLGNLLSLLLGLGLLGLGLLPVVVLRAGGGGRGLAVTVGILLFAAYGGFALVNFLVYSQLYRRLVRDQPADWVVVLGSGLGEGGRVPPLLASRVRTGLAEAGARRARMVIMSGGKGSDEMLAEAEAMTGWAVDHGADPARIMIENRSTNTEQNLRFSRQLIEQHGLPSALPGAGPSPSALATAGSGTDARVPVGPGLIVTSNYHALRAALLARKLGIDAQAVGAPTAGYYWPSAVIREFVAILAEHRWRHLVAGLLIAVPVPALVFAIS